MKNNGNIRCSFCGLPNDDRNVEFIIAGPAVYICNLCIDLCQDVLADVRKKRRMKERKLMGEMQG